MTSFVETTAISLRKGDTTANSNFTGILGELTADLGYTSSGGTQGTDINATLRLHNGITKGGIPMARADTKNITTKVLAENRPLFDDKNLAYADLSNIETATGSAYINKIKTVLSSYGMISDVSIEQILNDYALADMSNVLSSSLATGRGNNNLAYANTSNINTADLIDTTKHNGTNGNYALSYYNFAASDTTNLATAVASRPNTMSGPVLATADLSNIPSSVFQDLFFNTENGYNLETKNNKDDSIPDNDVLIQSGHYPTTAAVKTYVDNQVVGTGYLKTNLSNITTYEPLYATDTSSTYTYNIDTDCIISAGSGFESLDEYFTGFWLTGSDDIEPLTFIIDSVDAQGYPVLTDIGLIEDQKYGGNVAVSSCIIESSSNSRVQLNITSTLDTSTNIYTYEVSSLTILTPGQAGNFITNHEYVSDSQLISKPLFFIISQVSAAGAIQNFSYNYASSNTNIPDTEVTITSLTSATAKILVNSYSDLPAIGGAGLLKLNLSNLPGMSNTDASAALNSAWRINTNDTIPVASTTIDSSLNSTIATIGQVWRAMKNIDITPDYSAGINVPTGYTMPAPSAGIIIVHGQNGQTINGNLVIDSVTIAQFGTSLASSVNKTWGPFLISANSTFTVTGFNSTYYPLK